jgi:hypothetical protein
MIAVMPRAHRAVRKQQLFGLCATRYRFSINDVFYGAVMQKPPLNPDVADLAPTSSALTGYDEQHLVTYLRLLDAAEDGADWAKVAALVLNIDPAREPDRARRAWEPSRTGSLDDQARLSIPPSRRRSPLTASIRKSHRLDIALSRRLARAELRDEVLRCAGRDPERLSDQAGRGNGTREQSTSR